MKAMEKFGHGVIRKPIVILVMIFLLSCLFLGAFAVIGMDQEMSEGTFTPDIREAKADSKASDLFTTTRTLSIFVRAEDKESNIITPENMVDILELESELYADEMVRSNLSDGQYGDISSVADYIAQIAILDDLMVQMEEQMEAMINETAAQMEAAVNSTLEHYMGRMQQNFSMAMGEIEGAMDDLSSGINTTITTLSQQINSSIASTVQNYTFRGLEVADQIQMRQMVLGYMQPKLPGIEANATRMAYGMYQAAKPAIWSNVTAAATSVVNGSFDSLRATLTNASLGSMDNATARAYIEETINATMMSAVENASAVAGYTLGMELEGIVNDTVAYEIGMVSQELGVGFGYAFGVVMEEKSGAMMEAIGSAINMQLGAMNQSLNAETQSFNTTVSTTMAELEADMASIMDEMIAELEALTGMNLSGLIDENMTDMGDAFDLGALGSMGDLSEMMDFDMANLTGGGVGGDDGDDGDEGGMAIAPEQMAMMNATIEGIVTNLSYAMMPEVGAASEAALTSIVTAFSTSLGENLSMVRGNRTYGLIPLGIGLSQQVYAVRTNTSMVAGVIDGAKPTGAAIADDAVNTSIATVDAAFVQFSPVNLTTLTAETLESHWSTMVNPPLNATYKQFIGAAGDIELPIDFANITANMTAGMPDLSNMSMPMDPSQFAMPAFDPSEMGGGSNATMDNSELLLNLFSNISFTQKMRVYNGGAIQFSIPMEIEPLNISSITINLSYEEMSTADLHRMISDVYLNPRPEISFLTSAMNMSFSKQFQPPEQIESVGMLVTMMLKSDEDGDGDAAAAGPHGASDPQKLELHVDDLVERFEADRESGSESLAYVTLANSMIMNQIMDSSMNSITIILPIALLAVVVILGIVYRNFFDLGVSLFALLLAIGWVYGFGALMGFVFNPLLIAVPVLIVGLGIDFGIHITMRYREELKKGEGIDEAMTTTIGSVGVALLLATVTTVVAFLANSLSPIPALGEFGIMAAMGIIFSFFIMVTFVPAAKVLRDRAREKKGKELFSGLDEHRNNNSNGNANSNTAGPQPRSKRGKRRQNKKTGARALDRGLSMGALGSEHHPFFVLLLAIALGGFGAYAGTVVETEFDFKDFLPESVPIARELTFMIDAYDMDLTGGGNVRVFVEGDVATVSYVQAAERGIANMVDTRYVVKDANESDTRSIMSLMEDYATYESGGNDYKYDTAFAEQFYETFDEEGTLRSNATDSQIVSLYDYIYQNYRQDATNLIHRDDATGRYDAALVIVNVDIGNNEQNAYTLQSGLQDDIDPIENAAAVDSAIVTSGPILTQLILDSMSASQWNSILVTFVAALIIMGIVFFFLHRSFGLGVITVLPMIFCITWFFGTMFLAGLSLNVITITIASLIIGLGITYGIHVAHRFPEDLEKYQDIDRAMYSTSINIGRPVFGAAATTMVGFGLLVFTTLPPIKQFGWLTAMAIFFSFLAAVFVLPSFLTLWARYTLKRGGLKQLEGGPKGAEFGAGRESGDEGERPFDEGAEVEDERASTEETQGTTEEEEGTEGVEEVETDAEMEMLSEPGPEPELEPELELEMAPAEDAKDAKDAEDADVADEDMFEFDD